MDEPPGKSSVRETLYTGPASGGSPDIPVMFKTGTCYFLFLFHAARSTVPVVLLYRIGNFKKLKIVTSPTQANFAQRRPLHGRFHGPPWESFPVAARRRGALVNFRALYLRVGGVAGEHPRRLGLHLPPRLR